MTNDPKELRRLLTAAVRSLEMIRDFPDYRKPADTIANMRAVARGAVQGIQSCDEGSA